MKDAPTRSLPQTKLSGKTELIDRLLQAINPVFERPWVLHTTLCLLFIGALLTAFWDVLSPNVIFLAPDAPVEPLTFREGWERLSSPAPALLNFFRLLPFGFAYEGSFWFDQIILGCAAMFLLRGYRLPWGAAWVGAFAAAFTGYFATLFCAGHRGVVDAIAVTCLAFGLTQRALLRGEWRWFILLGILLPLGLAAQADIWLIILLGVLAYALHLTVLRCRAEGTFPVLKALCPQLLIALILFGISGIPAFRHTFGAAQETRNTQLQQVVAEQTSPEAEREARWQFVTDWSLPPEDCIDLVSLHAKGCTSYRFDPRPYQGRMGSATQVLRQHSIYIGNLSLLLLLLALICTTPETRQTHRFFWVTLAAVALLLAFGRYTPLYRLLWELPFINQIRAPIKWLHLTGFAVAILAGIGVVPILKRYGATFAILACLVLAINGVRVIRPFVFPIRLPDAAAFAQLPPKTPVYASPTFHALIRYYGLEPTQNPYTAKAALMLNPAPTRGFVLDLFLPEKTP